TALLMKSKHGRNMLAVREDELAAQMSGINTFRSKMLAMCMSALYAGIAGGMLAHYFGYLQPKMFMMVKSTEYTIMVIFGGMGSITGSVLGTVLLCALPELLRAVGDWRLVFYGLAVIIIMIVRPKGLMGGKELPVGKIFRAIAGLFTGKKKNLPPAGGATPGEEAQA
ncbi:MAG: branched-chain amino acid ABC transporter permease, partial [Oscillospiraceae bacterium]|nr:branched-chain amino acid ABC transporter permease [Oscillospiraceae bacterium]